MTQQPGMGNMIAESGIPWNSILDRAKRAITNPKEFWPTQKEDATNAKDFYRNYFAILAAVPAICGFIGMTFVGYSAPIIGSVKLPFFSTLISQIIFYGLSLGMLYVGAVVLEKLAPKFAGTISRIDGIKLLGYSMTPGLLAGVLSIYPSVLLLMLSIAAAAYGLYIFFEGIPVMTTVPKDRQVGYYATSTISLIAIGIVLGFIVTQFKPQPSIVINNNVITPGIDPKTLDESIKQLEQLQKILPK